RLFPIGDRGPREQDTDAKLAMAAVLRQDRSPLGEPGPIVRLALGSNDAGALDDARYPRDVGRRAVGFESAHDMIQIVAGIERDALDLRDAQAAGIERLVGELEDRAHRSVGDDAPALEVERAVQRVVAPDARSPSAERFADVEEIGAFAVVVMVFVVAFGIPLVDDRRAHALDPDVDAAAVERIDFPEALAVDAVADAVALPGDVVARALVRGVDACVGDRCRRARLDDEAARLVRREGRLEDELVRRAVAVVVDRLRRDLEPRSGVADAKLARRCGRQRTADRLPWYGDRLVDPRDGEPVHGADGELRGARLGAGNER